MVLICRRCTCDMTACTAWGTVPKWEQKWPATLVIPVLRSAKLTQVQLRRYVGVKLCDGSRCEWRTFSFVREVAQVVRAATSPIHRRHIRARLYWGKKLIVRFADVLVRSSFHCIFKKLSSKVFSQKKLLILNSERSKRNFQSHSFSTSFSANYHVNLTEPIFLTDEYMKRTQVIFSSANPCIQTLFIIGVFLWRHIHNYTVRRRETAVYLKQPTSATWKDLKVHCRSSLVKSTPFIVDTVGTSS